MPADAAVRVEGLNAWLAAAAERSLSAVHEHIPTDETAEVKRRLLEVVANRLLQGYAVDDIAFPGRDEVVLRVRASAIAPDWRVVLVPANLAAPVDAWFARDVEGLDGEIETIMRGVPTEALIWGDLDLKREIEARCSDRIPGWRISLMVRTQELDAVSLEVAFTPEQPLTLAVTPKIDSLSIPVMLHSNLKDDLLKGFAPAIGIPVPWLDKHADDLAVLAKSLLADEYLVDKAKGEATVAVTTGSVSELDIELESRRYAASVWMAVYAGAEDRYPEVGVHFGRKIVPWRGWDLEMYGEFILDLDDWDLETRLGARWSPWRYVWLGGEWSTEGDMWWVRAMIEPRRARGPYAWVRYSEEDDTNAGLGLRITNYLSIEIHYDSRDEDPWNIRALVNL